MLFPTFFEEFLKFWTQYGTLLQRGQLNYESVANIPTVTLNFVFRDCDHVAVASLAQLLVDQSVGSFHGL